MTWNRTPMPDITITDKQRQKFLKILADDHHQGVILALRAAGVEGSKGQLRRLYETDVSLADEAMNARGWNVNRVEGVAWEVAIDKTHPAWNYANTRLLKAYGGPQFRDQTALELTGKDGGPMEVNTDVSDAVERFTAAVARLATDDGETPAP